ncbi:hypothetical protein ACDT12_13065, partial [Staphylococcus aureus]
VELVQSSSKPLVKNVVTRTGRGPLVKELLENIRKRLLDEEFRKAKALIDEFGEIDLGILGPEESVHCNVPEISSS